MATSPTIITRLTKQLTFGSDSHKKNLCDALLADVFSYILQELLVFMEQVNGCAVTVGYLFNVWRPEADISVSKLITLFLRERVMGYREVAKMMNF